MGEVQKLIKKVEDLENQNKEFEKKLLTRYCNSETCDYCKNI